MFAYINLKKAVARPLRFILFLSYALIRDRAYAY